MNRTLFFLLAIFGLLLASCDKEEVQIRIENATGADLSSVYVDSNGNENTYSGVADGALSPYQTYAQAYRYGYVLAITTDNDTLVAQPLDYVGEAPLDGGRYTYKLVRVASEQPWLSIELAN